MKKKTWAERTIELIEKQPPEKQEAAVKAIEWLLDFLEKFAGFFRKAG